MKEAQTSTTAFPMMQIVQAWWPLAASWLLMSGELPALTAAVARLPNPEINLAAYGGVVSPLAIIIEAPILMLLAASTSLSKDWASYRKLRSFMMALSAGLTVIHLLVAFTPLYRLVVVQIMGIPAEVAGPAQVGLMIMTPWTWAIAYRRFNQGVLIRMGRSKAVGVGSMIRLLTDIIVLVIGFSIGTLPGVVVGTVAVMSGVMTEAIYIGIQKQYVLDALKKTSPVEPGITLGSFLRFYIPLAMTSMMAFLVQPLVSSALSRMPEPVTSLAVWPVAAGLFFIIRSFGLAYNEVVISMLDRPRAVFGLRHFTLLLSLATTAFMVIIAGTPLARLLFGSVYGLPASLVMLATSAIWIGLPLPSVSVVQSWLQGNIMYSRKTRGITEAVALNLLATSLVLWAGVLIGRFTGIYVAAAAIVTGTLVQTGWLFIRSRPAIQSVITREMQTF